MNSTKILVVEDEGLIAIDLKEKLENLGYLVPAIASNGADALLSIKRHQPSLVLMDIRLRGPQNGIETAAIIRKEFHLPVIFVTAHADRETLERAKITEPFGYIVKPFDGVDFRAQIEMALWKHRMERKLRVSEAWFQATLRRVGDGVITVDLEGAVDFMNPEAERLVGWTLAEARGKPVQDVFRTAGGKPAGVDSESAVWTEGEMLSRDGAETVPIESVVSLNWNEDGPLGTVIAFRDVTSRRELERLARQSRSMETVSVMAGALAHDFNNLLTVILGYSELIQSDAARKCVEVEKIEGAAQLAADLARQLLTVARSDRGNAVVFDLNKVLLESAKMLRGALNPACELVLKTSARPQYIRADKAQLQQALLNLTINAREAMPQGGRLAITTEEESSGVVALSVQDTGAGMDPKTVERIFEPFFNRKTSKGTGLGMTIVHSIVAQFGGTIEAESEPGRGSTFRVLLPRVAAEPERIGIDPDKPDSNKDSEPAPAGTILLVEDNLDIRRLLRPVFERAGFQILEADCGEDALTFLEFSADVVDLLITDVMMPGMTGPELAEKWVAASPRTRVLFISGFSEDALKDNELLESGRAEFIPKPVTPKALAAKAISMLIPIN